MKADEIFNNFLNDVSENVGKSTYDLWFKPLELLSIENDTITIKVPMEMHRKLLTSIYETLVHNTLFGVTGKDYTVKYVLEDEIEELLDVPEEKPVEEKLDWNTNLNPNLTFDNFIVGDTNRLAFVAAKSVASAPGTIHNPLFMYGRSGLGKTHLMHAIGNYITEHSDKKVLYTTSNDFRTDYTGIANVNRGMDSINYANEFKNKYRNVDVLLIDDIQFLVDSERTQQEFFHTFEALHQANKQIVITSDRSPDDLKKIEERLRSRFMWGLPVDIYPPDFNLRCEIIKAKLKKTSIEDKVNNDVIEFIANNVSSDVRHIEGTINRLLAYTAMMLPNKITLEFAIEALKDYVNNNIYSDNSIKGIQKAVADYFKINVEDLKSKKRNNKVVKPRHIAMYLCRMETDDNLAKIGLEFGGRDHSTVVAAVEKVKEDLEKDDNLKQMLKEIKEKL
jgi:chromosomal replication initiator protein